jgi:hypothetical protein
MVYVHIIHQTLHIAVESKARLTRELVLQPFFSFLRVQIKPFPKTEE